MKNRLIQCFLWVICCSVGFQLGAQEPNDSEGDIRYISDELYTYLHSGPGRNFRILGSVIAGTRVTVLQEDGDFTEVIDGKQRTGWVESDFISTTQSVRELVPSLQQQVLQANQTIEQQQGDIDLLQQELASIKSQNNRLESKITSAEKENAELSQTINEHDQTAQIEWFTRGGIVAVISLILGIIITYLPKKRRRNDNWM
ncbi:TIGR04211 family SH3 domain-containing protein [uncultured Paraglaciecola sp.]|uniref:TIGR04211 family SH3 domain-containing protein n=1 Tax=uncultured Paraglaciecola sp. TaxID=1765024 RepID=UPI0025981A8E|nr:TIGR04211 family SH3 domain-containing protein [uncultured Paraglaciecola sp.]